MPDYRQHRGPHPEDAELFSPSQVSTLREGVHDLSWLLTRSYAAPSAIEIVGNRYSLEARQRLAVARCAAADQAVTWRKSHQMSSAQLAGEQLWIDGYNVLTSIEAALSGGVILGARDGTFRDMASMHGNYRKVEETLLAVHILGEQLAAWGVTSCHWLLDQPVSNSGRLKTLLREVAEQRGWNWNIELVPNPDAVLAASSSIIATSDSQILDRAERWLNLVREIVESNISHSCVIDLSCDR